MSGDIPVETKKIETEAKPLLLTASASVDVYVQPEKTTEASASQTGGVSGFVQEYYAQPKTETKTNDCTSHSKEAEAKFRELLEKSSVKDLKNMASVQSQMLTHLRTQLDSCSDPVEKAEMARLIAKVLRDLKPKITAIGETAETKKVAATQQIQKGIDSGKVDLSRVHAQLKFESDSGTFEVKSSKQQLTIESASGNVTYTVKDGQLIERKNDVERVIGSADTRDSYVFKDGQLQKFDKTQPDGVAGPVIELGGDAQNLNASIITTGAKTTIENAGYGSKVVSLNSENMARLEELEKIATAARKDQPDTGKDGPVCGGGHKGNGEGNTWPSDPFKPGSGRSEPDYGRSAGTDIYDRSTTPATSSGRSGGVVTERVEQIDIPQRQPARIGTVQDTPVRVESDRTSIVNTVRVQGQDIASVREVSQQPMPPQSFMGPVNLVNRQLEVQAIHRPNSLDAIAPPTLPQSTYAQARMEQVVQQAASAQNALAGQSAPIGYKGVINSPANLIANSLNKQFSIPNQFSPNQTSIPNQQQQMFNSLAKSSVLNPYQVLRPSTTPTELSKSANSSLNSFGKSLQDVKDATVKGSTKNFATGSRLADLISDKTPGVHSTVSDKWTPVKAISGGGASGSVGGSDVGPFIPISGKVGGAGSSGGVRGEGAKGFGTKPDGKAIEGNAVPAGSSNADGGKKDEGIKSAEGIKSHGGSNGIRNTEGTKADTKSEGIKNGEGSKANGGSNIVDGGKKIDGDNGALVQPGVVAAQGSSGGGAVKDGKVVRNGKEDETAQGQSEAAEQKDLGLGYTPRRSPYTVKRGETLESIARQRWGDERLAELIRTINLHRLSVIMEEGKAVLKLSAGDVLWLPSPIEAERFRKVCNIKGDGQHTLTVGFSV